METLETQLILVREYQVSWIELVEFYGSSIVVLSAKDSFWIALLFTKLESGARRRVYSGRPEMDTDVTDDTSPNIPLAVMELQISPASVSGENIILV